ncbi:phage capsid family protein [Bartonella sp. B39]
MQMKECHTTKTTLFLKMRLVYTRDVISRESAYVTNGIHSKNNTAIANVRRAILLGSQSVIMAFGRNYNFENALINSEGNSPLMTLKTIMGMKKTRFTNSYFCQDIKDLATMVIATYAIHQY